MICLPFVVGQPVLSCVEGPVLSCVEGPVLSYAEDTMNGFFLELAEEQTCCHSFH
jgi:hypothetical protein